MKRRWAERWRLSRQGDASGFAPSTLQELAWQRTRTASRRWGSWGAAIGALLAVPVFAPAQWLADALGSASDQRLLLADAEGSFWRGSAVLVLSAGAGSRDAAALPGRIEWTLRPGLAGLSLRARHECCLNGELALAIRPGWNQWRLELPARNGPLGQWPASWLAGLGAPWNTIQLGGTLRVSSSGLGLHWADGRMRWAGGAEFELLDASSRLSAIEPLGSYRFSLRADAGTGDTATLSIQTLQGALRLSGSGQWTGPKLHLRGQARADEGQEAALANLLNIIGRRQGDVSVISIG